MSDKRAEILNWLVMMDQHHRGGGVWKDYGLALAALRGEVERHEREPEWRDAEDLARGFKRRCCCQTDVTSTDPDWPCDFLQRIHAATVGARA